MDGYACVIVPSASRAMTPVDLTLRDARASDCRFVWQVNNQRSVREQAVHRDAIPYAAHRDWYAEQLKRDDRVVLIGSVHARAVAVVRFDIDGVRRDGTISIAVCDDHSGRGFGTAFVRMAAEHLLAGPTVESITAYVRPANQRSRRMFERAGFTLGARHDHDGVPLISFELRRPAANR